jgi:polyhydroxyalkanoate synthesis repressor PhaR
MLIIKRYANRKLYNTETKHYIILDQIAELIRNGREIQVIDNNSGDDITTLVLSQIILEQEKKQAGNVPRPVLASLVQAGEQTMERMRRALANPIETLHQIDAEIEQRIDSLIARGEIAEDEASLIRDKLLRIDNSTASLQDVNQEALERLLAERGIPSKTEFDELTKQLEILVEKLESLK